MAVDLVAFQKEVEMWTFRNWGSAPSALALIKIQEELGELSANYIRRIEGRPDKAQQDFQDGIFDAVGDIVISLTGFCVREGISLTDAINTVWEEVRQRTVEGVTGKGI